MPPKLDCNFIVWLECPDCISLYKEVIHKLYGDRVVHIPADALSSKEGGRWFDDKKALLDSAYAFWCETSPEHLHNALMVECLRRRAESLRLF